MYSTSECDLRHLNGRLLDLNTARDIKSRQRSFIFSSLSEGLNSLASYLTLAPINPSPSIFQFFEKYLAYCEYWFSSEEKITKDPKRFHDQHLSLFVIAYEELNLSQEGLLFCEFLLGLVRFVAGVSLSSAFLESVFNTKLMTPCFSCKSNYWGWITSCSEKGIEILEQVGALGQYNKYPERFWGQVKQFYATFSSAKELSKHLVSMQYVPSGEGLNLISLAQVLHWNGFGGSGELLLSFERLQGLQCHALGYHQHRAEGVGYSTRLTPFKEQLDRLKLHSNAVLLRLIEKITSENESALIKVIDFCSGPKCSAIEEGCMRLYQSGVDLRLTAVDVDGMCLESLVESQSSGEMPFLDSVYYIDMAGALPELSDKYQYISASLGLHQLPDAQIIQALKYFVSIGSQGAVISIPDVGTGGYCQALMAPGNIVDREGRFLDVFDKFSFDSVAVEVSLADDIVSIPYPLKSCLKGYPDLAQAMYSATFFLVVNIPKAQLSHVQNAWDNKEFLEADQIIRENVLDFDGTQETISSALQLEELPC